MAITREQHEAIWVHLMTVVLRHTRDDNLWVLLGENGIDNVTDLMGEPETADNMLSWEYEYTNIDDDGNPVNDAAGNPTRSTYRIKRHEVNQLFILKDYIWKEAVSNDLSSSSELQHEQYMALTRDGYDMMRTDPSYTMRRQRVMATDPTNTTIDAANDSDIANSAPRSNNGWTPVEQFKRSIKRDMSLFPQLKNDEHFERWNRGTITQANIQDVAEVLDPNYKAIDQQDTELFRRKMTFMYGVFELSLLTDKGKELVRKHEDNRDSQSVYRDVKKHWAKRVVGYLSRMTEAKIRFRTEIPDYSDLPGFEYNWDASLYGEVKEEIPDDAPKPLGNPIILTHYVDANLYHDMITGRSVTGILHFVNQTPIDWFSKKQNRVETATYGSEFMAARTAVEKIMDIRLTFRYLGVPIMSKSFMFGDNEAVVNSAAKIDAKLHKRHNALSFHRVREAIASRMVDFYHIPGKQNPADILSKHWSYGKTWQVLQPLLFWSGDTHNIMLKQ